jgi:(p)ppGpp synthase/HD superfamily hydrolase
MTAPTIMRAAHRAAEWHKDQRRKGAAGEPYIGHLLEVAALVAEADEGNVDLIVAALLHDAIEDQPISWEQIEEEFGERVAGLVMEATDDKSLPKAECKRLQIETARTSRAMPSCSSWRTRGRQSSQRGRGARRQRWNHR